MRNIKLIIQYDGSNYSGWQSQLNAVAIQDIIEGNLKKITKEDVSLIGSGRTDKGVHSLGQVANFKTNSLIPAERFAHALNDSLPEDIRIIKSEEVDDQFHSRFDAKGKRYKYIIYNDSIANPIYRNYSYHIIKKLDINEMRASLTYFIGEHDFASFMGRDSKVHTSVRTIYGIEIKENGKFIEIIFEGKSFLRHMIRIIVGTLIFVGHGKIKKEELAGIISSKAREAAGPTAPAAGLFLEEIFY